MPQSQLCWCMEVCWSAKARSNGKGSLADAVGLEGHWESKEEVVRWSSGAGEVGSRWVHGRQVAPGLGPCSSATQGSPGLRKFAFSIELVQI